MKLVDALEILKSPISAGVPPFEVELACGFTPLHLETFLRAELRQALPQRGVDVSVGLFDDLVGNLTRAAQTRADGVVAVVEWPDLDARLGLRRLGGWRVEDLSDAVATAAKQTARLVKAIGRLAETKAVVCSLPTLPLPPAFLQATYEAGPQELALRELVASLGVELAHLPGIAVLGSQRLDLVSPISDRRDAKSEIVTGFPYTLNHASAMAEMLAFLLVRATPKKGLITDLDDTLWSGIVGEVGPAGVSWSERSQSHGLYQQFLASLANAGIMIAVASKNEPTVVDEVFQRADMLLPKDSVFPFEVHWDSKSASVERILRVWNIAPDAVVFVDDSPMEIAQVQSVFPDIEGIIFPGRDQRSLLELFANLRDRFGKHATTEEDAIRLASIRSSAGLKELEAASAGSLDEFLREADGTLQLVCGRRRDARSFELINKTNQFNLNGRRLSEAAFGGALEDPGGFLLSAAYSDKFGALGKIAAVLGRAENGTVVVESWVMSCRAFSRRIEHHCLSFLFKRFDAHEVVLAYAPTERNRPLRQFLQSLVGEVSDGDGEVSISREIFEQRAPALVHYVEAEDD